MQKLDSYKANWIGCIFRQNKGRVRLGKGKLSITSRKILKIFYRLIKYENSQRGFKINSETVT